MLETVVTFLGGEGVRHAVIGAFALHAYGNSRATNDLDLVVDAEAQAGLVMFLESLGYETLYVSAGYSNHLHADPAMGRLDFVYVSGETSRRIFEAAEVRLVHAGIRLAVPRPEHLAAMKILAMKNDPRRTFRELADIQFLLGLPGVDRDQIRAYFERHGLGARFDELDQAR